MADRKISDLTALTTPAAGDYLPIIDISESLAANKNKRITIEELLRGAPDGTAAAPGIAFESDPDSGLYSTGANAVAISTGGTGRLFVDASGRVGVGAAPSTYQLEVNGGAANTVAQFESTDSIARVLFKDNAGEAMLGCVGDDAVVYTSTSANERLRITSTGQIQSAGLGSAASPALSFTTDTNTGIYSPGADQVAISTNGTGRLFVTNTGDVCFGSQVGANNDGSGISIYNASFPRLSFRNSTTGNSVSDGSQLYLVDSDLYITNNENANLILRTNSAERLRITSTGQLSHIGAGSTGSPAVGFNGSAPSNSLVVDSSGRVGLGTSSPGSRLEVSTTTDVVSDSTLASDYPFTIWRPSSVSNGQAVGLSFGLYNGANTGVTPGAAIVHTRTTTNSAGELAFKTKGGTGTTDPCVTRMVIDSSGRVGVGTSSPSQALNVVGNIALGATLAGGVNGSAYQILGNSGTSGNANGGNLTVSAGNGSGAATNGSLILSAGQTLSPGSATTGGSVFITSGKPSDSLAGGTIDFRYYSGNPSTLATAMRIDSSGRVGVGTTSPGAPLHVKTATNDNIRLVSVSAGDARVSCLNDAADTTTQLSIQGDPLLFRGTGGYERARIDGSGRLGIGTTSPGARLHVYGDGGKIRFGTHPSFYSEISHDTSVAGNTVYNNKDSAGHQFMQNDTTELARIDSSGRLLVGTSSSRSSFGIQPATQVEGTGYNTGSLSLTVNQSSSPSIAPYLAFTRTRGSSVGSNTIVQDDDLLGAISWTGADGTDTANASASITAFIDGTPGANDMPGRLVFSTTADGASSPTTRMTIKEDGVVTVGAGDSPNGERLFASADVGGAAAFRVGPTAGTYSAVVFYDGANTDCGSIDINTTANTTAYTTSSDYRLKGNVQPLSGSLQRLAQLKPCTWEWLSAPGVAGEGFIAHEAQEVVPECVTGTKDEVDAEGNPVYQGIDQSKLVPLLTAALQEAIGEIESLKARVAALEAN